ncbi:pentapeptide repeat-containing protein [Amycolatopsis minnesotensis]|uniref:Pentapeptide repeat-containing protein n=1 Tax=Amycolatopsis minnesotensis TaxID=337894 RepID=A0ABP5DV04_9PSEU
MRLRSPLVPVIALAAVLLAAVTLWLLTDPSTSRADALKTGGLAAGSVVALYALWLNDRRRRVEESRHALDTKRYDRDKERVSDERFAKAVELLGSDADQVRVGALHVLVGLARARPDYTQTVLDVLCSYLRMPFDHPELPGYEGTAEDLFGAERELQVRRSVERQLRLLLPKAADTEAPNYDLHLTGATLDRLNLDDRKVEWLGLNRARLLYDVKLNRLVVHGHLGFTGARVLGNLLLSGVEVHGNAEFRRIEVTGTTNWRGALFHGRVTAEHAVFHDSASLEGARFTKSLDLRWARFESSADLRFAATPELVSLEDTRVDPAVETHLPKPWQVAHSADGQARIAVLAE